MRIVTSLCPQRIDRQKRCVNSWLRCGADVMAVQSVGEAASLSPHFPNVSFVETTLTGDAFSRPHHVRIAALADVATQTQKPVLIINSDLEIVIDPQVFNDTWSDKDPDVLQVGLRWDRHPKFKQARLFKWGIDAFWITPKIASELPDIGMTLGCPGWDYWLPWHMNTLGYHLLVHKAYHLEHVMHRQVWLKSESKTFHEIMTRTYGAEITPRHLVNFIQKATGREGLRAWRPII